MKIVLRNTDTGLFFQGAGQWTGDLEAALDFELGSQAIDLARKLKLQRVDILFAFEDDRYDFKLPLAPLSHNPPDDRTRGGQPLERLK